MAASMPYSITFASRSKKNCHCHRSVDCKQIRFLYFYVAALCNLAFTICGSYTEQVWPPLLQDVKRHKNGVVWE